MNQHKYDSILEAITNQVVGFVLAIATYMLIINPLFGLHSSAAESFAITSIFTVMSILRGYFIRRFFNGKSIYERVFKSSSRPD